ncbi:thioredoxin family protein [Providencia rettgeri]|uniref:thioredoxin family protein n=1 Tax=Providencia TaxID=586 RepID=UPI000D703804|nr:MULTISPECIES: thioredoxin family protein [Providencia]AWS52850.1 thioredoxin [Providencia rettgeri]EHZ7766212.1 thioredoxin family protein [Providencia rettgeri]EIJ7169354.1 thioredoxin family protein [Providencia rettgeri]EJD6048462.1 thioredoxin family protein [Providencia rettgeri]ELR5091943.1 thioredoxin family protein [Providencia rettgeri]
MPHILQLDSDNFSSTLYPLGQEEHQTVVVYFSASWCLPCKSMHPIFIKLSKHFQQNNIVFGLVDIAQSPTLAPKYGIKSVPTIAIFQDTRLIDIIAGEVSFNCALMVLNKVLGKR